MSHTFAKALRGHLVWHIALWGIENDKYPLDHDCWRELQQFLDVWWFHVEFEQHAVQFELEHWRLAL